MNIGKLLTPNDLVLDLRVPDKRRLLEDLARRVAPRAGVAALTVIEALNARETLGSTGVGAGIAIPHARLAALTRPTGFFARLRLPLEFDAIDGQKVDLVFLLLLPERSDDEQLQALASVARRLGNREIQTAVRKSQTVEQTYSLLLRGDVT